MRYVRTEAQLGIQSCKFCIICQHWHPINHFYSDRAKADGMRPYCKACEIARTRSGWRDNIPTCDACERPIIDCGVTSQANSKVHS